MIYTTSSARHIRVKSTGAYDIKRFTDGELCIKIHGDVAQKKVWVIAALLPPTDTFFELFLLLSALKESGATINLIITYLGYARQDKPRQGESASLKVIADVVKSYDLNKIYIIHPHSEIVTHLIDCTTIIPTSLFLPVIAHYDVVIIPDAGARHWVSGVALQAHKPSVMIEKRRLGSGEVELVGITGDVRGKTCLIVDDIIATGGTLIKEAHLLMEHGAREVAACATHGIFAGSALERIAMSSLTKVFVTNSVDVPLSQGKIHALDIAPVLTELIQEREEV